MLEKTRENETIEKFKLTPIGNIPGEQIDLKNIEIDKSTEVEYRTIRNDVIVGLNDRGLRYAEIETLQVQDVDSSFALIRIQRGNRVFRVAISKEISEKMKLLIKYKDYQDYIFTKNLIGEKPISRTMITKIIKNHKVATIGENITSKDIHKVERVCDKYMIYKNGQVMDGLVLNTMTNALRVCDVLNADEIYSNKIKGE